MFGAKKEKTPLNPFMEAQIKNMLITTESFLQGCEMAAVQDDGEVDAKEKKVMEHLRAATQAYRKELEKLLV